MSEPKSEVFNMDCLPFLRGCKDKQFDLILADPPYGIFADKKSCRMDWGRKATKESEGGTWASKYNKQAAKWDIAPPPEYFEQLKRISHHQIIFGANYFGYPFDNFVIWRKKTISENFSMSMAEIASVSCKGNGKVFEYQPQDTTRFHPTTKPIELYRFILNEYATQGMSILDPNMGSQSSRIAAYHFGLDYTGIEISKSYFDQGNKRFAREKMKQEIPFAKPIVEQTKLEL